MCAVAVGNHGGGWESEGDINSDNNIELQAAII